MPKSSNAFPSPVRQALQQFGSDISVARRRRGLTVAMMAERIGIDRTTYRRIERGDPRVAIGSYVTALLALGRGTLIGELMDPAKDEAGTLLDTERLPQRVRPRRTPGPKE